MLSNAYFVAKFLFDTAENEPAKNLQNFRKMQAGAGPQRVVGADGRAARAEEARGAVRVASRRRCRGRGVVGRPPRVRVVAPRAAAAALEQADLGVGGAVWQKKEACAAATTQTDCRVMQQTLEGSFSAVSKRNFARKCAFESSRRDLHNALLRTGLKSHFFSKNC